MAEGGGGALPNQWSSIYNFSPPAEGAPPHYVTMEAAAQAAGRYMWCIVATHAVHTASSHRLFTPVLPVAAQAVDVPMTPAQAGAFSPSRGPVNGFAADAMMQA